MIEIQHYLNEQANARNTIQELCDSRPDPLMIARRYKEEHHALTCALFAYGNVKSIVSFLSAIPPDILRFSEDQMSDILKKRCYRFQSNEDILQWFKTLKQLSLEQGAEYHFMVGYRQNGVIGGLNSLIGILYDLNSYRSKGYQFLIGKPIVSVSKASAMKRWMMYLRWMVREDHLDMGLWKNISKSDLIMPLDTHTFTISRRLGLLKRGQCDLQAAIELTEVLKNFDHSDPLKYDFALYRIGQEKQLDR